MAEPKSPYVAVDVGPSPHAEGAASWAWAAGGAARSPRLPAALHSLLPAATSIHLLWSSLPVTSRAQLLLWGAAGVAAATFAITQLAAVRGRGPALCRESTLHGTTTGQRPAPCAGVGAMDCTAGSLPVQIEPRPPASCHAWKTTRPRTPRAPQAWAPAALQDALLVLLTAVLSLGLLLDGYSRENAYQLVACLGLSGLQACHLSVYLVRERGLAGPPRV